MAHGFTAGKYSLDGLAGYLADRGYVALTFDYVGHKLGDSGGEMRHASQAIDNAAAALVWLREHQSPEKVALIGHSMGGIAVLNVASRDSLRDVPGALAGVVSLCAGVRATQGFSTPVGKAMLAQRSDYVAGAPAAWLIQELDGLAEAVSDLSYIPALFIAARQDVVVSPARVEELARAAGERATVTLIDTTHLEAPDRSRGTVLQWLDELDNRFEAAVG
jgi:pimeloyl-ACP methyl ester carboxylesterase